MTLAENKVKTLKIDGIDVIPWGLLALCLTFAIYARWPANPSPSLWLDEAWKAHSLTSTGGLISFIQYMASNTEFLLLSDWVLGKISLFLWGNSATGLRMGPAVFGVLTIPGVFLLLRRLGFTTLAPVAALMISSSWAFVYHSREFKPYAMDLAFTIWASWALLRAIDKRDYVLYFSILCVYALSSLTFVFVFPSLFIVHIAMGRPKSISSILPYLFPALIFSAGYFLFLRPQSLGGVSDFWSAYYVTDWESLIWNFSRIPFYMNAWSVAGWLPVTLLYAVVLPIMCLYRKDARGLLFMLPFIFLLVASALKIYPLFGRPSYFFYGLVHCGAVFALGLAIETFGPNNLCSQKRLCTACTLVIFGLLIFNGSIKTDIEKGRMWPADTGRYAMISMISRVQPGDDVFLNSAAFYTFRFHQKQFFPVSHFLHDIEINMSDTINDSSKERLKTKLREHCSHLQPGDTAWFYNAFTPNTHLDFIALLEPYGDIETVIGSTFQSLLCFKPVQPLTSL